MREHTVTTSKSPPIVVGLAEDAILRALYRYHYLTSAQLTRLLYSAGSGSKVRARMKKLTDADYCLSLFLPRPTRGGSTPAIYTLTAKGYAYLAAQGVEVTRRYRPSERGELTYLFLSHTLAVSDVLIGAELLPRHQQTMVLRRMVHELDLKRQPAKVTLGDGLQVAVIPDGWLDFAVDRQVRACLTLELDRGSEHVSRFRRKIAALLAYAQGPYTAQFGAESLTIATVAAPGEQRREELKRWTEAELTAQRLEGEADLFRFTSLAPDSDPATLFLAPHLYRPFETDPVPLIPQVTPAPT